MSKLAVLDSCSMILRHSVYKRDVLCVAEETIKFEKITAESLRQEKGFAKATKKQQKELETMKQRQTKERIGMQKSQCVAIEKLCKDKRFVIRML